MASEMQHLFQIFATTPRRRNNHPSGGRLSVTGDEAAARSLRAVTVDWTASLRDQAGAFAAAKIEQAIVAVQREDEDENGPPAGAVRSQPQPKRTGPER